MKIKEYIHEVADILAKRDHLSIGAYPYYFLGYYNSDLFKRRMRICKTKDRIREVLLPWREDAFANGEEIHIFLGHCFTKKEFRANKKHLIRDLTLMICHEIGHIYQETKLDKYEYEEQLIFKLENAMIDISMNADRHYQMNHDNYLVEIDADLYGSTRTLEILNEKKIPKEEWEFVEHDIHVSEIRKKNFDFEFQFEEIIQLVRKNPKLIGQYNEELFPIPLLYLRKDLTFEPIQNIIYITNNSKRDISSLSKRVITSAIYLNQLKIDSLSVEEKEYLIAALEERKKVEKELYEYNSQLTEYDYLNPEYIKLLKQSSKYKIKMYNEYLSELKIINNNLKK